MRIAIWVESLMGYGHALRAFNLIKAVQAESSCVISGSIAGHKFLEGRLANAQLAPLTRLSINDLRRPYPAIGSSGLPLPEALAQRTEEAWKALAEFAPTLLLFDQFPFGRFALLPEVVALIERTREHFPRCQIVSSVRDVPRGAPLPERYSRIFRKVLSKHFDRVVVHGDERLFNIQLVYPELISMPDLTIRYTGYLKSPLIHEWDKDGPCVIDLGGGWESCRLSQGILDWARKTSRRDVVVVMGNHVGEKDRKLLEGSGVDLLVDSEKGVAGRTTAGLCIGRAGYNMAVEVLASCVPVVFVPHSASTEQQLRAFILAEIGRSVTASEEEIQNSPELLSSKVEEAVALAGSWSRFSVESFFATPESLAQALGSKTENSPAPSQLVQERKRNIALE